jgi:hypothetical protein
MLLTDRSNVMELVVFSPTTTDDNRAQLQFDEALREQPM